VAQPRLHDHSIFLSARPLAAFMALSATVATLSSPLKVRPPFLWSAQRPVPSGTIVEATQIHPLPMKRRPRSAGHFGRVALSRSYEALLFLEASSQLYRTFQFRCQEG
jgi:hypothetical protein